MRKPLKHVALVTELAGPADEGMRVWIRLCDHALNRAGHRVTHIHLGGRARSAALSPRTWHRVRSSGADALVYVPYSGLTDGALVRLAALRHGTGLRTAAIAVLQSDRPPRLRRWLRAPAGIYASRRLRGVCDEVGRHETVAYPFVDSGRFRPPSDRQAVRAELGWPEDRPIVLHVGHLKASRNLTVLNRLADLGMHVVMVASTSTEADPGVVAQLTAGGVSIIREYLPDIERVYQAADVYVFPVQDPLGSIEVPLSVLEALACGTRVVTTPFGALPELFAEGEGLRFVTGEDLPVAVSEALQDKEVGHASLDALTSAQFAERILRVLEAADGSRRRPTTIVLSGIDGAGKSTQIERLRRELEQGGRRVEALWCRWDPWLAKPLVRVLDKLSRQTTETVLAVPIATSERRRRIRKRFLRLPGVRALWRALMVVDYAGRLAPRLWRARRRNDVLLLDRYWHDVMVDFSFGGDLAEAPRLMRWLLPDPDRIILLDLPEEVALARKPDSYDAFHLAERRRLYREVARRYGASVVDATRTPDEVAASVLTTAQVGLST